MRALQSGVFILMASGVICSFSSCGHCPDELDLYPHCVVMEFTDSVGHWIDPDSTGFTHFQQLELAFESPVIVDTVSIYRWFPHTLEARFLILPIDIADTTSTFVLSGPTRADTMRLTYRPERVRFESRYPFCGYQVLLRDYEITTATLDVTEHFYQDETYQITMIVRL